MTHAAEHLHVAQTALGIQIKNLEEELEVPLLERHSRGIRQTEAGAVLYQRAIEILKQVDAAANEVRQIGGADRPPVYFGITPSIMGLIGTDLIELVDKQVSGTPLRLVEELSFVLVEALERKELDFALTFNVPARPTIRRRPILEERLFFVTAPNDRRDGEPITFEETIRTDLALLSRRDVVWGIVHDAAERLSLDVRIAFEVQSVTAIKTLVERGVATSIMPYGVFAEEYRAGLLSARPIDNDWLVRTLYLTQPENAIRQSADHLIDELMPRIVELYSDKLGSRVRLLVQDDAARSK